MDEAARHTPAWRQRRVHDEERDATRPQCRPAGRTAFGDEEQVGANSFAFEDTDHVVGGRIDDLDPVDGDRQFGRIDDLELVGEVPTAVGPPHRMRGRDRGRHDRREDLRRRRGRRWFLGSSGRCRTGDRRDQHGEQADDRDRWGPTPIGRTRHHRLPSAVF